MNEVRIFTNSEFGCIRIIEMNGEPWFVGKDVAEALGYSNTRDALSTHVMDEDKNTVVISDGKRGNPNQTVINESGLYALIFGSKLESAKRFKHWVTSEVLPSIRRNGGYIKDQENLTPEQIVANALIVAQNIINDKDKQIKEMKPHAILGQAITTANTSILIGDLAKILKQNGVDMGAQRLFRWMREKGYLIKRKGTDWNLPTQRSMEIGLFEIKESVHIDGNGCNRITRTPKVTGKGQQYFVNKFLNNLKEKC